MSNWRSRFGIQRSPVCMATVRSQVVLEYESRTNNLPVPTDLTENHYGKKPFFIWLPVKNWQPRYNWELLQKLYLMLLGYVYHHGRFLKNVLIFETVVSRGGFWCSDFVVKCVMTRTNRPLVDLQRGSYESYLGTGTITTAGTVFLTNYLSGIFMENSHEKKKRNEENLTLRNICMK
jgi:hypothetical protein